MTTPAPHRPKNCVDSQDNPKGALTVPEVAAELAVTPDAVRDWITRGAVIRDKTPRRAGTGRRLQLRAIRIPQAWRIRRADLEHFLAQLAEANGHTADNGPAAAAVDQLIQPATYPASRRNRRKAGAA